MAFARRTLVRKRLHENDRRWLENAIKDVSIVRKYCRRLEDVLQMNLENREIGPPLSVEGGEKIWCTIIQRTQIGILLLNTASLIHHALQYERARPVSQEAMQDCETTLLDS